MRARLLALLATEQTYGLDYNGRRAFSIQVCDIAEVTRSLEIATVLASQVGQPTLKWVATFSRGVAAVLAGDIDAAESLADEVLQIGDETGQPDVLVVYGAQIAYVRWHQGRLGELADMVVQIAADNPGIWSYRAFAALALAESGRGEEARAMLEQEASSRFCGPDDFLLPSYLLSWARVASRLAHVLAAETLYDRLALWPDLVPFTGCTVDGSVSHLLGTLATVLGRYDDADGHFARALELHEKLQAPFFVTDTKVEWGQMLLARRTEGDLTRAKEMLTTAHDTANSYGFAVVARRAGEALAMLS